MKMVVFAHVPPPHHGQSQMVQVMLEGFRGDRRSAESQSSALAADEIECYHVDARFSTDIQDMGGVRLAKFMLVFRYCFEALWLRFRHGIRILYFVPAPPKLAALMRDWLVMAICRPFYPHVVHHWHAAGTMDWVFEARGSVTRWLTRRLLGRPTLGIALAAANLRDALWLDSQTVAVVPNGIDDPCPDFSESVLRRRVARTTARLMLNNGVEVSAEVRREAGNDFSIFRLLYLGHCFPEKGIFDLIDALALARAKLTQTGSPLRLHLSVAGDFRSVGDRTAFYQKLTEHGVHGEVDYRGFVAGAEKRQLLLECDCLCFPTYTDSFGIVVIEAMAFGLDVVATRWRAVPEILPAHHPGLVPVKDPVALATAIIAATERDGSQLRSHFLARFTTERHLAALRAALLSLAAA